MHPRSRATRRSNRVPSTPLSCESWHHPDRPSRRMSAVAMSDSYLTMLAHETAAQIPWDRLLGSLKTGMASTQWQPLADNGGFTVYTRRDRDRWTLLSTGEVHCSVAEMVHVLQAADQDQYVYQMEAMFQDEFRRGAYVHKVQDLEQAVRPDHDRNASTLTQLAVKTATFNQRNWLASHDEWCYLDAIHTSHAGQRVEKLYTSLPAQYVLAGKTSSRGRVRLMNNLVAGFLVESERKQDGRADGGGRASVRVAFYGELATSRLSDVSLPSTRLASDRAVKARLLAMARACTRFAVLVRRRRLGTQTLVDRARVLPPTHTHCLHCHTYLLVAKLCRLCGQGVCGQCSSKYEREQQVRGTTRVRLESVRVCELCLKRVDAANYAHVPSRLDHLVAPDPDDAKSAHTILTNLLQDALLTAPSNERKAAVMNVTRAVLGDPQDSLPDSPAHSSASSVPMLLTPMSSVQEHLRALRHWDFAPDPFDASQVANTDGVPYTLDPRRGVDEPMSTPIPANEATRLQAIQDSEIRAMGQVDELDIICNLAAKELGCFATMITIVDKDELYIAASNLKLLQQRTFGRNDSMCTHTVMDSKPLIVPHPEADVRFHMAKPVRELGVKYYCGFPLLAEDQSVIGSVCCADQASRSLTEAQYAALQRLADTAAKVVKMQTQQRRRQKAAAAAAAGGDAKASST